MEYTLPIAFHRLCVHGMQHTRGAAWSGHGQVSLGGWRQVATGPWENNKARPHQICERSFRENHWKLIKAFVGHVWIVFRSNIVTKEKKNQYNYDVSFWTSILPIWLWENWELPFVWSLGIWTCPWLPKSILFIFWNTRTPQIIQEIYQNPFGQMPFV